VAPSIGQPQSDAEGRPQSVQPDVTLAAESETKSSAPVPAVHEMAQDNAHDGLHDAAIVQVASGPLDLVPQSIPPAPTPSSLLPIAETASEQATVAGIWAPNETACSLRDLRDGLLPTIIDGDGARAGDTFCAFTKQKQTATTWRVVARCSNSREHWTTDVRLTVKDQHLIWASQRGRQIYTRCSPDTVMTAAR
jgi:hypothetical protein